MERLLKDLKAKLKFTTLAMIYEIDNDFSVGQLKDVQNAEQSVGFKLVATEGVRMADVDFTAVLSKIRPLNPDAIWLGTTAAPSGAIIIQARERGIKSQFLGGATINDMKFIKLAGSAAEGAVVWATYDSSFTKPAAQRFTKAYKERFNEEPSGPAALGYDTLNLIADAIRRVDSRDRKAIRDAVAQTRDFEGVCGIYAFGKGQQDNLGEAYTLLRVVGGSLVPLK